MLTGKKFGALFFSTLVLFAILFVPTKVNAQVGLGGPAAPTGVTFTQQIRNAYGAQSDSRKTFEVPAVSGKTYAITDGKGGYIVFEKGENDSSWLANNPSTERDSSKDVMIGTIFPGKDFTALKVPIPNSDAQAQKDAVNKAAAAAGVSQSATAWDAIMSQNDSTAAVNIQLNEARKTREDLKLAQEARDQYEAMGEDTTNLDNEIAALTKKLEDQQKSTRNNADRNQKNFAKENLSQAEPDQITCLSLGQITTFTPPSLNLPGCAAIGGNLILKGAAWILWTTALVFDYTLNFTLGEGFKSIIDGTPLVKMGWSIFRDIANLFFIFLLLFVSIGMILNSNSFGSKSMIPAIITAAVLINFSLFFTKVIIDASNIVTLQFYAQMRGDPTEGATNNNATGIAAQFIKGLNLTTLYQIGSSKSADTASGGAAASLVAASGGAVGNTWNIILVSFGGTILILITSFIFLAASILFINRAVFFVLLLTTSPIAFLGNAFPGSGVKGMTGKWWNKLWQQALFAPAYMALTYIVLLFVRSNSTKGNFAALFINGNADGGISTLLSFIMIIAFMVVSLTAATSFGGYGSSGIMSFGKKAAGWGRTALLGATVGAAGVVTRGAIGGTASAVANSNAMRGVVARLPGGGLIKAGADRIAGARFGTGKSFDQATKEKQERREKLAEFAGGSSEFRSRRLFEKTSDYMTDRETYQKEQKKAGEGRKNAALDIITDADGNPIHVSTTGGAMFSADARSLKLAQQKRIDEIKKKGKTAEDKVSKKKRYIGGIEDVIGNDPLENHFGSGYSEKRFETDKIDSFKKKLNTPGAISPKSGSKLYRIMEDIKNEERTLNNASTPGEIAKSSTLLNNYYKRRDALEEKVLTHIEAIDKLQEEA